MSARFDLDAAWAVHPQAAVRPEPFGALLYHFGTRRLSFLKDRRLLAVVRNLAEYPSAAEACRVAGIEPAELPRYRDALAVLAATENVLVKRQERVVPFWGPGERASVRTLRDPLGPIHFAGDYLLGVPSLTDAASSGERAAAEVLQRLA